MNLLAEKLFYAFSAILLAAGLFVLTPTRNPDTTAFQTNVKNQFAIAAVEVFGDSPVFDNTNLIISSVNEFYNDAANATIALLAPAPSEKDLMFVTGSVYKEFASLLNSTTGQVAATETINIEPQVLPIHMPADFMQEAPISNIVPNNWHPEPQQTTNSSNSVVSSVQTINSMTLSHTSKAINDAGNPWVTLRDVSTGQVYCVAIFNSDVNRYIGPCTNDYH